MDKLEQIEEVGQKMASRSHEKKNRTLNSYACVYEEKPADYKIHAICFAGIAHRARDSYALVSKCDRSAIGDGTCQVGDKYTSFTRSQMIKYYSWLARKSPYRKAFMFQNASHMVDKAFAVFRTDRPANLVVAAMSAQRQAWEYTQVVDTWLYLREHSPKGNPSWHFMLGHVLKVVHDKAGDYFVYSAKNSNHVPLNSDGLTFKSVRNFLDDTPERINGLLSKGESHQGIQSMFGGKTYGGNKEISSLLKADLLHKEPEEEEKLLFSWNENFFKQLFNNKDRYPADLNVPILEAFYNKHFGGDQ